MINMFVVAEITTLTAFIWCVLELVTGKTENHFISRSGWSPHMAGQYDHETPTYRIPTWNGSRGAMGLQDFLRNVAGCVLGLNNDE